MVVPDVLLLLCVFSFIAEPLFRLMRKNQEFLRADAQQEAIDESKRVLTSAPALKPIDYEGAGLVVLSVDSSLQGCGAVLQQEDPKTRNRYPPQ